jgi:hypothetical protein
MLARLVAWLTAAVVLATGAGSATGVAHVGGPPPRFASGGTVTTYFATGRHARSFRLREQVGVILRYTISAPVDVRVRAWAQVPHLTAPLEIRTVAAGASSACARRGSRIVCTQGEEWCPMPRRTWHLRILKLAGRAGDVVVRFRVGTPPRSG